MKRRRQARRAGPAAMAAAAFALLLLLPSWQSAARQGVTLYLFSAKGCHNCTSEKAFLERLRQRHPELEVKEYEIAYHPRNAELLVAVSAYFGVTPGGAPMTFIGTCEPVAGYMSDEQTGALIEERVLECIEQGCEDPVAPLIASFQAGAPTAEPAPAAPEEIECPNPPPSILPVPFLGETDLSRMTLPTLTVILALLDSFNPCAFFVLFTLLGILAHARSRRRMLFVGGVFVFFSGFIYFLFMSAWLNIFMHVGGIMAITKAAGAVALFIAAVNIKDFFYFKKGVSLTIPESAKPRLFERMRGLLKATSTPSMVLGTVVLAAAANTYELFCTVGFPLVFTRILTLNELSSLGYYAYLGLYNVLYVIPLGVIVVLFSLALGSRKLSERHGQAMKLVSGVMMLFLGAVILKDPSLFSNVLVGVSLLGASLVVSAVIAGVVQWKKARGRPA